MVSILLTPEIDDRDYLQSIINQLGKAHGAPVFSPHCTLHSTPLTNKTELLKSMEIVAKKFPPFTVKMKRLNQTEIIWKTVFIELEKSEILTRIQQEISDEIPNLNPEMFLPHISLMYKIMPTGRKLEILKSLEVKKTYKMNGLTAMVTGDNVLGWREIGSIGL